LSTTVFLAVIVAAALHAVWNALAKGGRDKLLSMTAVVLGHAPLALAALPFVPAPAPESWPYVAGGIALHVGYQLFLISSYRHGDLTHVYPIARGTAPLLVAGVSTLFLGVTFAPIEVAAVLVIALGIMSLSFVRQRDGTRNPRASLFALVTGCFIAGYSLNDGMGARLAGSPVGFYAWEAMGNAFVFTALMAWVQPGLPRRLFAEARTTFVIGGSASFLAYALVVWAFTQAPIPLVTALRETSVVFALMIGVWVLRERLDLAKVLSTFVTMLGAVLLRFARH
jgi:drug/metabolite transporter (DMT)-like permease